MCNVLLWHRTNNLYRAKGDSYDVQSSLGGTWISVKSSFTTRVEYLRAFSPFLSLFHDVARLTGGHRFARHERTQQSDGGRRRLKGLPDVRKDFFFCSEHFVEMLRALVFVLISAAACGLRWRLLTEAARRRERRRRNRCGRGGVCVERGECQGTPREGRGGQRRRRREQPRLPHVAVEVRRDPARRQHARRRELPPSAVLRLRRRCHLQHGGGDGHPRRSRPAAWCRFFAAVSTAHPNGLGKIKSSSPQRI